MQRGRFIGGRNAHQARDPDPLFPAQSQQLIKIFGKNTRLLRFFTGIHLYQAGNVTTLFFHFLGQRPGDIGTVNRLDHIEQRHRIFGLVGLQRPDQV